MRVLHHHTLSAASRYCRLLLAEKKLNMLLKIELFWERHHAFLALNPSGNVPVLVEDNNTVLAGPWPITEYLEETEQAVPMLGNTPADRAEIRRLLEWFFFKFEREVVSHVIHEKWLRRELGEGGASGVRLRQASANLAAHLEYLNWLAERRHWLGGSRISAADLYAAAALSVLDFFDYIPWDDFIEAKTWYSRIKSRPSFRPLLADQVKGISPPAHYTDLDF